MKQETHAVHEAHQPEDTHNHNHTGKPDTLRVSDQFYAPLHRQIAAWLDLAPSSRILDAGCGGGGMTRLMASAVGSGGLVVGLDTNPELLEFGRAEVAGTELAERIRFQQGDMRNLPFEAREFDLVWCSRAVHGLPDQLAGLRELTRVLRPGGRLVIREGGLPFQFLPFDLGLGEPGLNGRLQVAWTQRFANWRNSLPDKVAYPFGWSHMLREAGLSQVTPQSFLYEFTSPLEANQKEYLEGWLSHHLHDETSKKSLAVQDTETLAQLLDPTSVHYVFDRDDLHCILAETIYVGRAG